VFNGRYELHRQLARGGMAEVFLARDQLLDRPVAVKVLFPEYATDPSFVERFRREAQAAANLNHPNIVSIYDWGEENGTYFIVMEYVQGRSLAEILREEGPLHPDRAADVAIDVAGALGFAHRNGLVHRDIKPGNVLVAPNGQVKVADFGIATAMNAGDVNLTKTGLVMGTATYFSPEQAQGKPVDPRSDLYSLGVVLYEMLAGEPPFRGENPVAIAYKHVQEAPLPLHERGVQVAESLEAITLKLLAKNPAHRYPSAEDLRADLRRYRDGAHQLMRPAAAAAPAVARAADVDVTRVDGLPAASRTAVVPTVRPDAYYPGGDGRGPKRRNETVRTGVFAVLIVLVLIVLLAILILLFANNNKNDNASTTVAVPVLINKQQADAEAQLRQAGLEPDVQVRDNEQFPAGVVFGQDPAGGSKVKAGTKVRLDVSRGNATSPVPNVVGINVDEADQKLVALGFTVTRVPDPTSTRPEGEVLKQDPAQGTQLEAGKPVALTFSSPEEKVVPDVAGQTAAAATKTLTQAGWDVVEVPEPSATVEAGKVTRTDPPANGKLKIGQQIKLFTSSGPEQVLIPPVVGLTSGNAINVLQSAGFQVNPRFQDVPAGSANVGIVIAQSPDGNTMAKKNSPVIITVGRAPTASPTTTAGGTQTTTTRQPTPSTTTTANGGGGGGGGGGGNR
jgi:serine/threonine-protein kinase